MIESILDILDTLQSLGPWGLVLFILTYALITVAFIPASPFTIAAAPLFGFWKGVFGVICGALLGITLVYILGRNFLYPTIYSWSKKYPRFLKFSEDIKNKGALIVFLIRLSPIFPYNVVNYLFSISSIKYGPYLIASFFGMIPGIFLYVYIGFAGKQIVTHRENLDLVKVILLIAGLISTGVVAILLGKMAKKNLLKNPH